MRLPINCNARQSPFPLISQRGANVNLRKIFDLSISSGSLAEIDRQLELAIRLGCLDFSDELFKEIHVLERMIYVFATSVKEKTTE